MTDRTIRTTETSLHDEEISTEIGVKVLKAIDHGGELQLDQMVKDLSDNCHVGTVNNQDTSQMNVPIVEFASTLTATTEEEMVDTVQVLA